MSDVKKSGVIRAAKATTGLSAFDASSPEKGYWVGVDRPALGVELHDSDRVRYQNHSRIPTLKATRLERAARHIALVMC
jgi:hypothetical protein